MRRCNSPPIIFQEASRFHLSAEWTPPSQLRAAVKVEVAVRHRALHLAASSIAVVKEPRPRRTVCHHRLRLQHRSSHLYLTCVCDAYTFI